MARHTRPQITGATEKQSTGATCSKLGSLGEGSRRPNHKNAALIFWNSQWQRQGEVQKNTLQKMQSRCRQKCLVTTTMHRCFERIQ